jgi:hypothetical protein
MEEKTGKIILPMKYATVYTAYEDGLYIVLDTLNKYGLYSATAKKMIVEPQYNGFQPFSEGVAVVQKKAFVNGWSEYTYGAVDKSGKLVIEATYPYLGNCRDGMISFKKDDKYGYIDKYGSLKIPATYYRAENFANGLAPVQATENDKYGYINTDNKFVIEPQYVEAASFYEGYASVYTEKKFYSYKNTTGADKMGVIDTKGKFIIPPIYQYISLKNNVGLFRVTKDSMQGLIDSTGKMILPVNNKGIGEFAAGIARVEKTAGMYGLVNAKGDWLLPADNNEVYSLYSNGGFYAKKDGKYTVYNNSMKVLIAADTAKRVITSKKNIAYVYDNAVKLYDVNGKLIKTINQENIDLFATAFYSNDDSLKVTYSKTITLYNIPAKKHQKIAFDDISDFNEEGIFVGKKSYKHTFYDYTGKRLTDKSFESVVNFSEGICALQVSSTVKPYIADKSFTKIAELSTVFNGPYSEGVAMTKSQYGGSVTYLDKKGNVQFFAYAIDGGACKNGRIILKDASNKFYYVNKNGQKINTSMYDVLAEYADGLAGFKENKKCGFIDTSGNIIIAAQFDEASAFYKGVAMVMQGKDFFQIDKKGKPITNDKYVMASSPANGTYPVKKGTNFGLIGNQGQVIIDFKYQDIAPMYEDMIWAKKNGKWGLLNSKGTEVTAFEFDGYFNFDNGYAKTYKNGKLGLIDKTGKAVLPIEFFQMSKVYKNTIITVKPNGTNSFAVK